MANNRIQIKRSTSTATPSSLLPGELAYSNATGGSGILFIGSTDGGTVVPIAGARNPGVLTANQALVVNSTSAIDKIIVANLVPTTLWANGAAGAAGQALYSNGSAVYWANPAAGGGITGITAGNGLTGGGASGTVTVDVGSGNGISVSADAIAVTGGPTLTVNATGVHVNSNLSISNLTVSGNVNINGTLTTISTNNLTVSDSLIKLANGNSTTDSLDIGFYGVYGNATNTSYTGIFRDASDSGIYKFFTGLTPEPTTTVDTTNTSFTTATIQAFVRSGGLTTNSTSANLIANSTYAVGIVANSLTLSTALAGTSGGTGKSTVTNNAILVGNSTNGYNELTLGTSGYVLQSNGSALIYDWIDGGTF